MAEGEIIMSKYYRIGYSDGYNAAQDTDWQPGEIRAKWEAEELEDVARDILENWQQMAGTIYYDNFEQVPESLREETKERALDNWEEGFYRGFEDRVNELIKEEDDNAPPDFADDDIRLDHIPDVSDCRKLLRGMKQKQFCPNVWHINERGNTDLLRIGYNGAKIVKSWV
jgi:hypothetical protein